MVRDVVSHNTFRLSDLQVWSHSVPSSNRKLMTIATLVLILVVGLGGFWAITAPLGGAVIASGRVVAQGRNVAVQNLEGGILARVLVVEGQKILKNQVLAEMDTTATISQLQRVRTDRAISMIELDRWRAERDGVEISPLVEVAGDLAGNARVREAFESQRAEFFSGRQAFIQSLRAIDGKISNEEEDLVYLASQLSQTERQLILVGDERINLGKLQEKGLVANSRVLALDRELSRLEAEKSNVLSTMEKSHNNIRLFNEEKQKLHSEREVRISERLTELQKQLTVHEDQLTRLEDIINRSKLTSPVDGIVFSIPVKSIGAVIQPGHTIAEILPSNVALEMEVQVLPKNIDDVYAGQSVGIVFPSDQADVKPPLKGQVSYVSPDAFLNGTTGEMRYVARVSIGSDWDGRIILPGMIGETFFQTETRTLLELLADPITRFARRTFEG